MSEYARQLLQLVSAGSGMRFSARSATAERFEGIDINGIADEMQKHAPDLWDLLGILLNADPNLDKVRKRHEQEREKKKGKNVNNNDTEDQDEANYWRNEGAAKDIVNDEMEDFNPETHGAKKITISIEERQKALLLVVSMSLIYFHNDTELTLCRNRSSV